MTLKHNIEELLNEDLTSNDVKSILKKISTHPVNEITECIDNIKDVPQLIIIRSALSNFDKTNKFLIELFHWLLLLIITFILGMFVFTDMDNTVMLSCALLVPISALLPIVVIPKKKEFDALINIMLYRIDLNIK